LKIAIQTLGCKVNQAESASIEGILRNNNYEVVNHTDNPDICIVNTCTVTAKSDYQSRQLIRKAAKTGVRIIATGCYAQLRPDELSKIKGVDLIVGNSEKDKIHKYVDKLSSPLTDPPVSLLTKGELKGGNRDFHTNIFVDSPDSKLKPRPYFSKRSRAFLKIQDGCDFSCSYCTIPLARGRSRSLIEQDVLKAVDHFSNDGYKEIVLTGIHIGSYGLDLQPESSLLTITEKIATNYQYIRLRLSSIEPYEFETGFLSLIQEGKVCPHLHIPLQSGSDRILGAMNRTYSTSFFEELINRIISMCPDISIGTDVIAGFPGETDKDFDDTLKFIEKLPLSYLHIFPYSNRPHTKAATLGNQINDKIKKSRVNKLLHLSKIKKNEYLKRNLGQVLDVIVEQKNETSGLYNAISENYIRLAVDHERLYQGQRLSVKVISFTDSGLVAKALE
jgi:threonylcarbamoyladenosine tRNA methylthiotransferase MtaB